MFSPQPNEPSQKPEDNLPSFQASQDFRDLRVQEIIKNEMSRKYKDLTLKDIFLGAFETSSTINIPGSIFSNKNYVERVLVDRIPKLKFEYDEALKDTHWPKNAFTKFFLYNKGYRTVLENYGESLSKAIADIKELGLASEWADIYSGPINPHYPSFPTIYIFALTPLGVKVRDRLVKG